MTKWIYETGNTAAEFKVKHMMITWVRGTFKNVEGSLEFDPENIENTSVEVKIDAKTLWSGDKARDEHLKGEDFLDVENHPVITFKGNKIEDIKDGKFRIVGELTIRGISKKTSLDVSYLGEAKKTPFWVGDKDEGPVARLGFVAKAKINFKAFDVNWDSKLEDGVEVAS